MKTQETNATDPVGVRPIVVGVSGSRASYAALRWAVVEAAALGVPMVAVHAWEPSARLRAPYATAAERRSPAEDQDEGERVVQAAVSAVLATHPGVDVRATLAEGPPNAVLLRHTGSALLLALGQSLHQNGAPTELGPVTRACVKKSHCPVVTVPEFRTVSRRSELPMEAALETALAGWPTRPGRYRSPPASRLLR